MTSFIIIDGEVISLTEAMHRFVEQQSKEREKKDEPTSSP